MPDKNKFGLSRNIPEKIKQKVRKRVGFGCVRCGLGFYQYEHFNPDYSDAKEHREECITLLCPTCHSLKTTKKVNSSSVERWNQKPKCLKQGFSSFSLPSVSDSMELIIQIGSTNFHSPENILKIDGESVIKLERSGDEDEPILLTFRSSEDESSNRIVNNEWITNNDSWDIKIVANRVTVKNKNNHKILDFEYNLGNVFKFHALNIKYKSIKIETVNIREKKFGSFSSRKQKVIRVINSSGVEISRFGSNNQKFNDIVWKDALDVKNDYMNHVLSGLTLNNGDFHYLHNSDSPIVSQCNFKSSVVNIGASKEIIEFINFVNRITSREATKIEKKKFRSWLKYLKHIKLFDQVSLEKKKEIMAIKNWLQ